MKNNIIKANTIIEKRNKLSTDITKYWNIIKSENVVPKGYKRNYDLKAIISQIKEMADERILTKLYIQCINMGYTKFTDLKTENNYVNIFTLSEKKEQLFHMNKIRTLDTKEKRKKGKKNMDETEELTKQFIQKEINTLQLEINALEKSIKDFNDNAEFDISSPAKSLAV